MLMVLALVGCSTETPTGPAVAELVPLAIGTEWTYEVSVIREGSPAAPRVAAPEIVTLSLLARTYVDRTPFTVTNDDRLWLRSVEGIGTAVVDVSGGRPFAEYLLRWPLDRAMASYPHTVAGVEHRVTVRPVRGRVPAGDYDGALEYVFAPVRTPDQPSRSFVVAPGVGILASDLHDGERHLRYTLRSVSRP